jgi:retinol dehydrogenase 14
MTGQSMQGKTVLVTGASSGIGLEASVKIAALGADVAVVARDERKGDRALEAIVRRSGSPRVSLLLCDLSSLASCRALAATFRSRHPRLDVLVNNAGTVSPDRRTTADGFEQTFAVNHLAAFLLTNLLLDLLVESGASRVVTVSSAAHRSAVLDFENLHYEHGGYSGLKAYARSKLANVLFATELSRRLAGSRVTSNCLHPGIVATNIWSHTSWYIRPLLKALTLFMISPERGGDAIVHLATSPDVEGQTGGYYEKNRPAQTSPLVQEALARRLWDESLRLTGLTAV